MPSVARLNISEKYWCDSSHTTILFTHSKLLNAIEGIKLQAPKREKVSVCLKLKQKQWMTQKLCCSQWKKVIILTPKHFIISGTNTTQQMHPIPPPPAKVKHVFQLKLSRKSLSISSTWSTSCAPPSEVTGYVLENRKCMIELFTVFSWASQYLWPLG